jgi:hypothetical protein
MNDQTRVGYSCDVFLTLQISLLLHGVNLYLKKTDYSCFCVTFVNITFISEVIVRGSWFILKDTQGSNGKP